MQGFPVSHNLVYYCTYAFVDLYLTSLPVCSLSLLQTQKAHKVTQFHITCWRPDGHCSNLKSVTDVIEMTKVQIRSGNKPIVVHCSDTVTRSGMFCAIATTIEKCKTEGVVECSRWSRLYEYRNQKLCPLW